MFMAVITNIATLVKTIQKANSSVYDTMEPPPFFSSRGKKPSPLGSSRGTTAFVQTLSTEP